MREVIIPLDWEVAPQDESDQEHLGLQLGFGRPGPLREAEGRSNLLGGSAALRHELARTASLGGLEKSPRPTDVAGYTRSGDGSFCLSQYTLRPNKYIVSARISCSGTGSSCAFHRSRYDIYGERVAVHVRRKMQDQPCMRNLREAVVAADGPLLGTTLASRSRSERSRDPPRSRSRQVPRSAEYTRMAELDKMSMEDRELWAVEARSARLQAAIHHGSREKVGRLRDHLRHWDQVFLRRLGWAWSQWAAALARARRKMAANLQRPHILKQAGLVALQRCRWRAQPKQRLMIGFIRTCSRPHLTKSLQSWRHWAAERDVLRKSHEHAVLRILNKRVASAFDCWIELLDANRRRLQLARGVVHRMQERGVSRSWARWCWFVEQMQQLQAVLETWVIRSHHAVVRAESCSPGAAVFDRTLLKPLDSRGTCCL
eukprot:COSAG02_NODE_1281_length_13472_cov_8.763048_10_plen_430_part_00